MPRKRLGLCHSAAVACSAWATGADGAGDASRHQRMMLADGLGCFAPSEDDAAQQKFSTLTVRELG